MRDRILVIGSVIVISLMSAIAFVSNVLIDRFDKIELAQTTERAAQVVRAFEADLDQLAMSTRDYAEWDDAQAYAIGQKDDFIAANFSRDSPRGMDDEIFVEYQPVVDLRSGLLVSFEALARWRNPDLGMVSSGRFIPVAEKSGLIVAMTEQIVRNVLMQLSDWQRSGLLLAPVAVNVAPCWNS